MAGRRKSKGSVIAALDIGSTKIACFIARMTDDDGGYQVLGVGHQASIGVKNGKIVDLSAAEASIRHTVHAAENMAASELKGYPLRDVIVNVPDSFARSFSCDIEVNVSGQDITDHDVKRALARAQEQVLSEDMELIHTIPVRYRIDDNDAIKDPREMYGDTLEVGVHLVTSDVVALRNMASCVERSHLDIEALCLSSYASGLACLVEDEMDLGTVVIDMGGGTTSLAVFQDGHMVFSDVVPLGGRHITSDIAKGLTTSLASAERLKTLYGHAMGASTDGGEMIDVPQLGEEAQGQINHVPRSLLIGIIQPRLEETLELVRDKLRQSGHDTSSCRRVVLTGGSSQLSGVRDLTQLILDKQVRLGAPIRTDGLAEVVRGSAFSVAAGLLTYIAERSDEMPAEILAHAEPGNLWQQVKYWLKENW